VFSWSSRRTAKHRLWRPDSCQHFVQFLEESVSDPAEVITLLAESGFEGFLLDDHVPKMDGDTPWGHRGRAHAIGYMQGLIRSLEYRARKG
jgi:mannonate dehydratase